MNNGIIDWPGNESHDTEDITPPEIKSQATPPSLNDEPRPHEGLPPASYQDDNGFSFNSLGVVLLVLLVVYSVLTPEHGIVIFCLAINVLLHELGHYAAGRTFKCVMCKVSIFLIPAISYKANSCSSLDPKLNTWRDTEWTLGMLPLGGYTTFLESTMPPPAHSDHSGFINHKPAWQRLIINAAGIVMNLLTFAVCYAIYNILPSGTMMFIVGEIMYLALILAVLNVLPFYPLDGSSICTAIYEVCSGRKPSNGFMKVFKVVGAALMVYLFFINPNVLNKLLHVLLPSLF